ncbi:MAG: flippase-like domain-containing protein [Chloroflexi bacterium]|nr:flippase-like domain-containing protein [Chloroflexota bacterium]
MASKRSLGLAIAVVVVILLALWLVDVQEVRDIIAGMDPTLALLSVGFLFAGIFLIDVRWHYLLARIPRFRRLAHATHVSFIVPLVSPIPNAPIRPIITGLNTEATIPQAASAIMVERMIAQIMRLTTIILAIMLGVQAEVSSGALLKSGGIAVGVLALFLLAVRFSEQVVAALDALLGRAPGIKDAWRLKITNMVREALAHGGGMKELVLATGMTLIMWSLFYLFHLMIALAMPLDVDLQTRMTIAMGALALTPPSAPAMFGIYHVSQIAPMLALGLADLETLLPYSLVLYFVQLIVWSALTLWGLRALNMRFRDLFRFRETAQTAE